MNLALLHAYLEIKCLHLLPMLDMTVDHFLGDASLAKLFLRDASIRDCLDLSVLQSDLIDDHRFTGIWESKALLVKILKSTATNDPAVT